MSQRVAGMADYYTHSLGPQRAGGRYYCGYWRQEYEVLGIGGENSTSWSITVRWADGSTTTHCTPWDERRDHVISQPE